CLFVVFFFFFSSRRRHTRLQGDWSSDVCSSDLDHSFGYVVSDPANDTAEKAQVIELARSAAMNVHVVDAAGAPIVDMNVVLTGEIGRASCRERVEMSVGEG